MATVTIEPVAWQWSVHGQWYTVAPREVTDPETYAKRMAIETLGEARAIFTSESLAQARAEGKAEGMEAGLRFAAKLSAGQECWCENTNSSDPVHAFNTGAEAMRGAITKTILAALPSPPADGEVKL